MKIQEYYGSSRFVVRTTRKRRQNVEIHATSARMAVVALVSYREQRGERNWMWSSSNPRRKGRREKTETFIFPLFIPFSHFRMRDPVSRVSNGWNRALLPKWANTIRECVGETRIVKVVDTYNTHRRDKLDNVIVLVEDVIRVFVLVRALAFNLSGFCLGIGCNYIILF